jgi:hypothetical protein
MDWIHMAQDRARWLSVVRTIMNLHVPCMAGNVLSEHRLRRGVG